MTCNYLYRSVSHFIFYTPIAPTILSLKSPFCPSRRRRQHRSFSISAGMNSFTWDDVFQVPESPLNVDSVLSAFSDKIKLCNRNLEKQCEFMPFVIEDQIIGYVHHGFADFLKPFHDVFIFPQDNTYGGHFGCYCTLHPNLSTPEDRTKVVANVIKSLEELIPGIRNELFPVASAFGEPIFFSLERAAAPYFGIKVYGVHMCGYLEKDGQEYLWLGKRSEQKATYPGMLDHLAAGGLPHDISCGENLIKECEEEAGIPRSISHKATPVGAVSYVDIEGYRMKRDVLFCYDLKLPDGFIPHNEDGEVESFRLVPVTKVANIIRKTSFFKANCNLVIIDFLFRHGPIVEACWNVPGTLSTIHEKWLKLKTVKHQLKQLDHQQFKGIDDKLKKIITQLNLEQQIMGNNRLHPYLIAKKWNSQGVLFEDKTGYSDYLQCWILKFFIYQSRPKAKSEI